MFSTHCSWTLDKPVIFWHIKVFFIKGNKCILHSSIVRTEAQSIKTFIKLFLTSSLQSLLSSLITSNISVRSKSVVSLNCITTSIMLCARHFLTMVSRSILSAFRRVMINMRAIFGRTAFWMSAIRAATSSRTFQELSWASFSKMVERCLSIRSSSIKLAMVIAVSTAWILTGTCKYNFYGYKAFKVKFRLCYLYIFN